MATPSMSMNQVIHAAVRRDLDRFRTAIDAFRDGDRDRAAALHRAWTNFDAQLTEHHEGEHEIAFPAMRSIGVPAETVEAFDTEHEAMAAALAAARAAMATLNATATRSDADTAGSALATLQTTAVTHFEHEERETESLLESHHDDPAMKEMGKKFARRAKPPVAGTFFAWVQDGATPREQAALRQSVPAPVLAVLTTVFGRDYRKNIAPVWR